VRHTIRTGVFLIGGWLVFGTFGAGSVGDNPLARLAEQQRARAGAQPNDPKIQNDLGNALSLAGDPEGAEAAYRNAIAADPASATAHYNLGRLMREQGRGLAARRELKRALGLDPLHAFAWFQLAMVYDSWGIDSVARRDYARAFRLAPALADPASNPYLADSHLAFEVVLRSWSREAPPPLVAPSPGPNRRTPKPVPSPSTELDPAEASASHTTNAGGGFARSIGAQPRPPESASNPGGAAANPSGVAANPSASPRRSAPIPARVIDRSNLSAGSSVNQVTAPGAASRAKRGNGFGGSTVGRPGRQPFSPPLQPTSPFVSDQESTGRLEIELQPVDPDAFAFGSAGS
jgi:Tetratricopeptide repeat